MVVSRIPVLFLLVVKAICTEAATFDALAWQSTGGSMDSMVWPEVEYIGTPSTTGGIGITLSGGGDRAFTASIGYLRYVIYLHGCF